MVRLWVLQERAARLLLELHAHWQLSHHDVLVRGIPGTNPVDYLLLPCLDSVLQRVRTSGQAHAVAIADRIARQTATLAADLTRKAA